MLEGLAMIAKIAPGRRDAVIKLLFGAMHKRQYMGPQVAYSQVKGLITKDCEVARKFVEKDQKGWFDRIENVFKIPDSYNAAIAANGHGNALAPGASGTTTESIATGDSKAAVGSVQLDDTATSVQVSNIPYEYRPMNHKEDKQPLINLKRNNSWLEVSASELPDKDMEKKRRLVFAQEIKAKKAHMRSMKYDAMERKTASYEEALDMFGVAYTMATELVEEHNAKKG